MAALPALDRALARRLAIHEAAVHVHGRRELRDLGTGVLLHDPDDPEPFWNRIVAPAWPDDAAAVDRQLDAWITLFATLGRLPHLRTPSSGSGPRDLQERLREAGFRPVGRDRSMVLVDEAPARALAATLGAGADLRVERLGGAPPGRAMDVARILVDAFGVETDRLPALAAESMAAARRPGGATLLLMASERPVATVRSVTQDEITYLSSIGTVPSAQGRGYGSLLTAVAVRDALDRGSAIVHLLAEAAADDASRLYARLGFATVGPPVADLLMR